MSEDTVLPEAPISVNIKGYYKGFSIQLTKRDPREKSLPLLEDAIKVADWMIENGFKPSWNEDTNKGSKKTKADPETCTHPNVQEKVSAGHNKPENKGRAYLACGDCGKFMGWKPAASPSTAPEDF